MIRCLSCGNDNRDGEAFCAFCAAILQAAPPTAAGVPPPRAPVSKALSAPFAAIPTPPAPPVPPPPSAPAANAETAAAGGDPLDPLDQFLKKEAERKNGPNEFMVEELGSFASNFDNLEDQLEDAHRAAVLKQKMAAIHASESTGGGDKLDQLDAILDLELEKAKQAALEETGSSTPSSAPRGSGRYGASAPSSAEPSEEDKLAKLERYKKFLEDPSGGTGGVGGGNELIRYLEAKVNQQTVEIEKLKQQKQDLVREVFSDALSEDHDDTKEKLAKAEKDVARLEAKLAEMQEKRVTLEEKLLAKGEQVAKLLEERQKVQGNQDALRAQVEAQLGKEAAQLKARLQQSEAHAAAAATELATVREQISRQTGAMVKLRTELEQLQGKGGASSEELEQYRQQVVTLQQRVKKTMSAGATQLKALASYYEVILNHIREIVIVFDVDENIMLVNRAARAMLQLPPQQAISGKLKDFAALGPVVPAAERAIGTDHTMHGGDMIIRPDGSEGASYRLSFCPIVFPGREAFLLIMDEIRDMPPGDRALPPGAGLAEHQLAALKEQVFSLKILAEIVAAKPDRREVVEESAGELKREIGRILDLLNDPAKLV